jgi:hypothetical protein
VPSDLREYLTAFWRLDAQRGGELSPQPITMTAIESYCNMIDVYHPSDRENFIDAIQFLDNVQRTINSEKAKESTPDGPSKTRDRPARQGHRHRRRRTHPRR